MTTATCAQIDAATNADTGSTEQTQIILMLQILLAKKWRWWIFNT